MDQPTHLIKNLLLGSPDPELWIEFGKNFVREDQVWKGLLCYEQAYLLDRNNTLLAQQMSQLIQDESLYENLSWISPCYQVETFKCLRCDSLDSKHFLCACGGLRGPVLQRYEQNFYPQTSPKEALLSTDQRYLFVNLQHQGALFGLPRPLSESDSCFVEGSAIKGESFRPLLARYSVPLSPWLVCYALSSSSSALSFERSEDLTFLNTLGIGATVFSPRGNQVLMSVRTATLKPKFTSFEFWIKEEIVVWPESLVLYQRMGSLKELGVGEEESWNTRSRFEWDFEHQGFLFISGDFRYPLWKAFPQEQLFQASTGKRLNIERVSEELVDGYSSSLWNHSSPCLSPRE
jgi:hypothetical protein